ncbi:hypothetical protein MUG91_G36n31 [Manis pentadactyla]|nr:hypothetical protein MUG91_G36n31 [Manis pentadactyla]
MDKSPQASATSLVSSEKDVNLPILFQVPDVSSKVQPRTVVIPNNLKLPLENFMSHRMRSLHPPAAWPVPRPFHGDILIGVEGDILPPGEQNEKSNPQRISEFSEQIPILFTYWD